jgi:pimeloyl-ACP methyl ester carboxylesterase
VVPTALVNGIEIEYVTEGDPADPPMLLVMGLGAQLTAWPDGFVDLLRQRFFVVRFDNRDCGLSTKFHEAPSLGSFIVAFFGGEAPVPPYRIEDMADDAAALLDHLGIEKSHVVGVSLGGMITQALAINHGRLLLSAASVMSTTGDWTVGAPTGEAVTALLRPAATNRDEYVEGSVAGSLVIGSPGYPSDEAFLRQRAREAYDRAYCPEGTARQIAAVLGSADRTEGLHGVRIPFLVVHGEDDPLLQVSGGRATAAAVPGSELVTFPGMGHDLPQQLWEPIIDAIVANTERAAT